MRVWAIVHLIQYAKDQQLGSVLSLPPSLCIVNQALMKIFTTPLAMKRPLFYTFVAYAP